MKTSDGVSRPWVRIPPLPPSALYRRFGLTQELALAHAYSANLKPSLSAFKLGMLARKKEIDGLALVPDDAENRRAIQCDAALAAQVDGTNISHECFIFALIIAKRAVAPVSNFSPTFDQPCGDRPMLLSSTGG